MIPILRFQVMHDYVCFIAPIDYCVEKSLVHETFCKNCSYFILKWFQPNSFGELYFLEKSYENMQKIQFLKFWERPLFDVSEYAFRFSLCNRPILIINIEYNKRLDGQRPYLEDELNGGSNNIVQTSKSVWRRW